MSDQIGVAHVQQFKSNVIMLSQQKGTRLRNAVRTEPDFLTGKSGYFERIGATNMQRRTTRHGDTPLISTPHSRVRVTMDDFEWADLIDQQDRVRMLIDPESPYTQNAVMAAGREMDDIIIGALGGNIVTMDEDDSATSAALPSGQKIAHNSTGFVKVKLIEARKKLLAAEAADPGDTLYCAINAACIEDLLNQTEVTSSDYNSVKALVEGQVDTWLGFKFIHTERLQTDGTNRLIYCWHPNGVGLAVGEDVVTRISERDDKGYSTQVYLRMTMGATRIEDEKVVEIAVVE